MFGKTAKIKEILEAGINTSIGTDSPSSGEINILEEMRFAKRTYREIYREELDDKLIVEMITRNPAKAFRMQEKVGSIARGLFSDLLVVSGDGKNPYAALVNAGMGDIALVLMEGKPIYGDVEYGEIFQDMGSDYTEVVIEGKNKYIIGDPKAIMKKLRKTVGFHKELPFLPI
jgi:cytosine/adenosine deaminase-related metal-dependent hydrolase